MADSYTLPHAGALSEFASGYNGDCGQTAALAALHILKGLPLDAATLRTLVLRDIAAGRAAANGAEPITSIAATLSEHGVHYQLFPFRQGNYSEPEWHPILLDVFHGTNGRTPGPIILELSNGQALPGDERHLAYHFITVVGIEPADYQCADGDNPLAAQGKLAVYGWQQLQAAGICALLVCQMPPAPAPPPSPAPDPRLAQLTAEVAALQRQIAAAKAALNG